MAVKYTIGVALISAALIAPTGCTSTTDPTTGQTRYSFNANVNNMFASLFGITNEQQQTLQQQSPQTWETLEHNAKVASANNQNNPSNPAAAPAAPAAPGSADLASSTATPGSPPATPAPSDSDKPTPLALDDIKAMASSGIKEDVICDQIAQSQAVYTQQDVQAAQQVTPPLDPQVIACMKQHMSS